MDTLTDDTKMMLAITIGLMGYVVLRKKNRNIQKRRCWVKPWLAKRDEGSGRGVLAMVQNELRVEDKLNYCNFLRMTEENFQKLLSMVREKIERKNTQLRQCISAERRLSVTLRFLATGDTLKSLSFSTRIAHNTFSKIVNEVLNAIAESMESSYLKVPSTTTEWEEIAADFLNTWNFPNCLDALDGKHIVFRPPRSDGSFYRNYKGTDSIVLLALADAQYKFLCVDIGTNGRISDGGIFARSAMSAAIYKNALNFPPDKPLPGRQLSVPYVVIADDAFPLKERIMKPYRFRGLSHEQKIFNYRLSRARRVIENAFGILTNRFRIFLKPMNFGVEKVELITKVCCILHNFLITEKDTKYISTPEENKSLDTGSSLPQQGGNKTAKWPTALRQEFQWYFNTNGKVSWQSNCVEANNL